MASLLFHITEQMLATSCRGVDVFSLLNENYTFHIASCTARENLRVSLHYLKKCTITIIMWIILIFFFCEAKEVISLELSISSAE